MNRHSAVYSLELVVLISVLKEQGGNVSGKLKTIRIASRSLKNIGQTSSDMVTSKQLWSLKMPISSVGASPASQSQLRANEKVQKMKGGFGLNSQGSFAWYNRDSVFQQAKDIRESNFNKMGFRFQLR